MIELKPGEKLRWRDRWWRRRHCFHQSWPLGTSYIESVLIQNGSRKMFWCAEKRGGCGKTWFS